MTTTPKDFEIRPATEDEAPLILEFIKKLAVYEKLAHKVTATEDILRETLFGERRYAEVIPDAEDPRYASPGAPRSAWVGLELELGP